MALPASVRRGILASPFLVIAFLCITLMDPNKMEAHWTPFLDTGKIEWDGGSIPILATFYHNKFMDETWRPFTVVFAPSALGFDPVAWWQGFSFLNNLAPMYAIWMLESRRAVNKKTPVSFPALFALLGQFIGQGTAVPLFYFLCLTFGPGPAADAKRTTTTAKSPTSFILPLMLAFHTLESFAAFTAPDPETRHWFTWTWQLLPLWVGLGDAALSRCFPAAGSGLADEVQLGILTLIAAGVWGYMLKAAPYSLATILWPDALTHDDFVPHARFILQLDNICTFGASFLWLAYSYAGLHRAGVVRGRDCVWVVSLLPIVVVLAGPAAGAAFAWWWKQKVASRRGKQNGS